MCSFNLLASTYESSTLKSLILAKSVENVSCKQGLIKLLNSCFIYKTFIWRIIYMTQHLTMLPRSAGGNDKKKILFHLDLGNKKIFLMQIMCSLWYIMRVQICIYNNELLWKQINCIFPPKMWPVRLQLIFCRYLLQIVSFYLVWCQIFS